MTRPISQVNKALALRSLGFSAGEIAERLSIPRGTVNDWISGRFPQAFSNGGEQCAACSAPHHKFEDLPPQYVYLLGLYLGDGSIASHARGVYRLRLSLDPAYPGIIDEAVRATAEVLPQSKVTKWNRPSRDVEVYSYSKVWPCLFPQHGPGKKHHRRIALTKWQQRLVNRAPHLLLRGLIHSDGCRFLNTGTRWKYPRYSFTNFSPDIRLIFRKSCDLMGLRWTTSGPKVYVSRKVVVDKMDLFIGPKA